MRVTVILVMALWAVASAVGPAHAADPVRSLRPLAECSPAYYGTAPPWSVQQERPPRKGIWYFTAPLPPGVNFLVPMTGECSFRPPPWTPAWYSYCAARWPSFNPKTGTIVTPDGVRMCI